MTVIDRTVPVTWLAALRKLPYRGVNLGNAGRVAIAGRRAQRVALRACRSLGSLAEHGLVVYGDCKVTFG